MMPFRRMSSKFGFPNSRRRESKQTLIIVNNPAELKSKVDEAIRSELNDQEIKSLKNLSTPNDKTSRISSNNSLNRYLNYNDYNGEFVQGSKYPTPKSSKRGLNMGFD